MANPILDDLTAQITRATTVAESAKTLIDGIGQRVTDAVAAAIANGATAEELAPVAELATALDAEATALEQAVIANTP
jgi:hypothetical protein